MIEAVSSKCVICGFPCDGSSCERCGTILADGKVVCEACGNPLAMFSFECEYCGNGREGDEGLRVRTPERDQAIEHFLLVPGMTKEAASELYDEGVRDFATLVGKSLPQSLRDEGIHQTIARRIMLMDMVEKDCKEQPSELIECLICKSRIDASSEKCEICGHYTALGLENKHIQQRKECHPKIGEVYEAICIDRDFREMPEDFQDELSKLLAEMNEEDLAEVEDSECDDVAMNEQEVEMIEDLEERVDGRITPREEYMVICPLCEVQVLPTANYCHNCGVKFSQG